MPFVWDEMKKAPYGIPGVGRYNHIGQAFFYFADTKAGAESEILKHLTDDEILQTVSFRANGTPKIIDLSGPKLRRLKTFVKYIGYQVGEDNSKMPKMYLIPNYVSDCCRNCGIDGIKYYGGKDYSNYVTWDDHYYRFVGML